MSFDKDTYKRQHKIGEKTEWTWIHNETGAWDGPLMDWENGHLERYKKYCKDFRTVIQAGGNQGLYAHMFSTIFKNVYTFEPDALNFHCLVNNCQSDNVFKFNCALGTTAGTLAVHRNSMVNTGTHTVGGQGYVPVMPLDAFNLPEVDLIQLDVEGFEMDVLLGALATIEKHRPLITIERTHERIAELLKQYGYEAVDQSFADTFYLAQNK